MPGGIRFLRRTFPSANMVLVNGREPVLVDTGFGGDLAETERLLRESGTPPEGLALVVNTHYHSDHAGGNAGLQSRYGLPVAAHRWEAELVNGRDREACSAEWLAQPVEPYRVDRPLSEGDEVSAGGPTLRVLHTPGHTLGHISLYAPEERTLIMGDAAHGDDVAWINPFREGAGAMVRALESLERLSELDAARAYSGHGAAIEDPPAAIDAARRRYEKWLGEPEKVAWHGCKRIFSYALMILDGMPEGEVRPYLLRCPWFLDYSRHAFGCEPEDFLEPLISEVLRSGAAERSGGRLVASAPHTPPPPGWPEGPSRPKDWPSIRGGPCESR
jgi:hydroxyacylglutathione hydrolase